jgi:uncharacterized glyoxalase superfamily protein PhnB
MTTRRFWSSAVFLTLVTAAWSANPPKSENLRQNPGDVPALMKTCLITDNVKRLVDFYEPVLALRANWSGRDYAEFSTAAGVLAIFSEEAQEKYIPGSTEAAKNRSMVLQFRVGEVDQQYRRLQTIVKTWVKPPTTQPWGTRSIYFRDPDGNLVDFYTPPKTQ